MEKQPKVTILLPLKNYHPRFLNEAVASIMVQTDPVWKLLAVVERGDRRLFQNLLAAALADSRVGLTVNEGKRVGGALNTGMRQAQTAFVGVLLGDDCWAADAVQVLNEAIRQHPEVDFFHSSRIIIDAEGRPLSSVHPSPSHVDPAGFETSSPVKHLLCWRREMGLAVGGMDEAHNHGPDDYDFPWTMAQAGAVFRAIPEPLYQYRDHRQGYRLTTHVPLSSQKWALRRIMKRHGAAPEQIRARIAAAEATYLRQSLFANHADRRRQESFGYDADRGWKDQYR